MKHVADPYIDDPIAAVEGGHLPPVEPAPGETVEQAEARAAKRIASAAARVEQVEGDLAMARREHGEAVAKRRVALKAAIEAGSGISEDPRHKLTSILSAHQDLEESEAARKIALADILDRKKKARAALRQSFDSARQLEFHFLGNDGDGAESNVDDIAVEDDSVH